MNPSANTRTKRAWLKRDQPRSSLDDVTSFANCRLAIGDWGCETQKHLEDAEPLVVKGVRGHIGLLRDVGPAQASAWKCFVHARARNEQA